MSSRNDYRRGERSSIRDRYDEHRRSRSRSPPRRGGRERRDYNHRDYVRDQEAGRRDRDRRDDRRREDPRRRDYDRDRDSKREAPPRERESFRDGDRARDQDVKARDRAYERGGLHRQDDKRDSAVAVASGSQPPAISRDTPDARSRQTSEIPTEDGEEGEAMEAMNDEDAAMMAMMGLNGFGTTKGKHVEGNQEGGVQIKKMRTWRQYMNRRGGFNRPLDKIK